MKTIIKLTNEYGSNLNCLFFNFNSETASYYAIFDRIFHDCLLSNDINIAEHIDLETLDIVFININEKSQFKSELDMRMFMNSLRKEKELLPIYIIKNNIKQQKTREVINQCYSFDGMVPAPFEHDKIYRFLYRILKRIMVGNELAVYVADLEHHIYPEVVEIEKKPKSKIINIDNDIEKDIRFSQFDKISAVEFMASLDDSIIDKVEELSDKVDELIGVFYDMESDVENSLTIISAANNVIEDMFNLVDSMGVFSVTARAFERLNIFLSTLSEVELDDVDKKTTLISMLLAITNDLERWIDVIFFSRSTNDIHYLDASFTSNILEIENLFVEENDTEDDDGLEFF